MRSFYASLDTAFVKYCPQPMQHVVVADKARKLGGEISFYTMEDFNSLAFQGAMRAKIEERPPVEGMVYFTLRQFCYGDRLDLDFMKFILNSGFEVHFAREDISIENLSTLDDAFPMLYSAEHLWRRDASQDYLRPVWESLSTAEGS